MLCIKIVLTFAVFKTDISVDKMNVFTGGCCRQLLCFFLVFLWSNVVGAQNVVNVALRKPSISAYVTCGMNRSDVYITHDQIPVEPPSARKSSICSSPTDHPPTNMNDGDNGPPDPTFWLSAPRVILASMGLLNGEIPESAISINLEKVYPVQQILIEMGKFKRPGIIVIKKSVNSQTANLPWAYRVSQELDCRTRFGIAPKSIPSQLDTPICEAYSTQERITDHSSVVKFDFTAITGDLVTWTNAQNLRIEFYDMDFTYGWSGGALQYYAVNEIKVMAECQCNNLELKCEIRDTTGQYECVCGGFTQGDSCQECQSFYRQQPYQPGQPCEQCNCFNHTDTCHYNETVANLTQSFNTRGEKIGGGVCDFCRDNTAGINCERCEDKFYRPAGLAQTGAASCVPCQCFMAGVRRNELTGLLGDCVMNDDAGPSVAAMVPGDCFCKQNVQSSDCSTCKPGYFNLTDSNPLGCQDCDCDGAGMISGTAACTANSTGLCPCKVYVTGRRCDTCMDTFYGLTENNTDGCFPCECDIGGAVNNSCNPISGQCRCQRNVRDRQCLRTMNAYYSPDAHFIHGEFEKLDESKTWNEPNTWGREGTDYRYFGYAVTNATVSASASLTIPLGTQFSTAKGYMILIRYRNNPIQTLATIQLRLPPNPVIVQSLPDIGLSPCMGSSWCYYASPALQLTQGLYEVSVIPRADVLLDRVVAMPDELVNNVDLLGLTDSQKFLQDCDIRKTDQIDLMTEIGRFCASRTFSMMMLYLNGALPCDCNFLGSYGNMTCDASGGQCVCKTGVFSRNCGECKLEYYDLTAEGCKPCDCATDDKVCNRRTGQCVCPPLTSGRICDRCELNHWNWTSLIGCQPCGCNVTGASNLQCNLTTGVCECKQGVTGDKCDECITGYMGFSATGCTSCQCDPAGTLTSNTQNGCSSLTGQCPCKANSEGFRCESCKIGTFYNHLTHDEGCLDCVCMGITTQCQSTFFYQKTFNVNIINETDPSKSILFLATDGNAISSDVNITRQQSGLQMADIAIGATANTYWQHPSALTGNLLGLYGSKITFSVYYTATDSTLTPSTPSVQIYGIDNSLVEFPAAAVPIGVQTQISVTISEKFTSGVIVTRQDVLKALVDVKKILIPAAWYPTSHQSFIGGITYQKSDPLGTEERSLAVEQCQCPDAYQGLSCETCSPGYRRDNITGQGYLGYCVLCDCHDHSQSCDPDTGECLDCQHNTQGFNCQICMDGYHGDATSGTQFDCIPCPCYSPRVTNSTCQLDPIDRLPQCLYCEDGYTGSLCNQCEQFYFGNPLIQTSGTCQKCDCNNNTDICDPISGICRNCDFNTTGSQCERCKDGFYGNASEQICNECLCNPARSLSQICDPESGNCTCYPGIGTRTCEQCLENHYPVTNLTFTGCIPCECNEFGSAALQCLDTGICSCLSTIEPNSTKCDTCIEGYWGLPDQPCQQCGCDTVGTVDPGTGVLLCDRNTGQCQCKPGVAGRTCDVCDHLFINFGPTGCQKCGRCQDALGNDTIALETLAEDYLNKTLEAIDVQTLDPLLQNLTNEINDTRSSLGISQDRLSLLTDTVKNLSTTETMYRTTVQQVITKVENTVSFASLLKQAAEVDLERLQGLENRSQEALSTALTIQTSAPGIIQQLTFYNNSAYDLLTLGNSIYFNMNTTFDSELQQVRAETTAADQMLIKAKQMQLLAQQQGDLAASLLTAAVASEAQLKGLRDEVNSVTQKLQSISFNVGQVYLNLNITMNNREEAVRLLTDTQNILNQSETTLVQSAQNYIIAEQWFKDCLTVYNGVQAGPLPLDSTFDLTGIRGWLPDSQRLEIQLNSTQEKMTEYESSVVLTEATAARLTQEAQNIQDLFQRVQSSGQDAVNAINNYEEVVFSLNASLQMAKTANETMSQTVALLQMVSVEDLNAQAVAVVGQSQDVLQLIQNWNSTPAVLTPQIVAANTSLANVINRWSAVNSTLTNLQDNANTLQERVTASPIPGKLSDLTGLAGQIMDTSNNVIVIDDGIRPLVDREAREMAVIQGMVNNASTLHVQIERNLNTFQDRLANGVQRTLELTNSEYEQSNQTRQLLEKKLRLLEEKLLIAEKKLAALEQPVSYDYESYETLQNIDKETARVYTEVVVEFSYRYVAKGVLFFSEDLDTKEKILLHLDEDAVKFEIQNVDSVMKTKSPAVLCPNCWFRVVATRYGIDGALTVTKIDTGGVAISAMRFPSSEHQLLRTTSLIYVGGLPKDYPQGINKTSPDPQFEGCLYNMQFNGGQLPIWQRTLSVESTARCCERPPALPAPPTVNALDSKGFGYVKANPGEFKVHQQGQVTLQFRTFHPNSVLLLIDDQFSTAYYGLFMSGGYVQLDIRSDDGTIVNNIRTTVTSTRTYNDGLWYKVSAVHNSTFAQISVQKRVMLPGDVVDTRSSISIIQLATLAGADMTIAGQNPNTTLSRGPIDGSFPGAIVDFQLSQGSNQIPVPWPLARTSTLTHNVNLYEAYQDVVSGVGLSDPMGYVSLKAVPSIIRTIEFDLLTYQPSALLLFVHLRASPPQTYFYVGLFNGNIMVMFDQGLGTKAPLRTRGRYFSTGNPIRIKIDFSATNTPRLEVSDGSQGIESHVGQVTMSAGMSIEANTVYLGGVPPTIALPLQDVPTAKPLNGGIRNLMFNSQPVDIYNKITLSGLYQQGASLSGLPAPLDAPFPLPYTTTPAPPTTPPPTCAPSLDYTMANDTIGIRFSGITNSYIGLTVSQWNLFTHAFVVKIQFRAVNDDGNLVYFASHRGLDPSNYFSMFLKDGYLYTSMQATTNLATTRTLRLNSTKNTYGNGNWWQVEVLRIEEFMAIIVNENKDYANNGVSTTSISTLNINTPLFAGGVPAALANGRPFRSSSGQPAGIPIGTTPFRGCIRKIEVTTRTDAVLNIYPSEPAERQGTLTNCYDSVSPGMYLQGTNSYIMLTDGTNSAFDFTTSFSVEVNFTSTFRNGTLISMWQNAGPKYFLLGFSSGQIKAVLSNSLTPSSPFIASVDLAGNAQITCDREPHVVKVSMSNTGLGLEVDGLMQGFPFSDQNNFRFDAMYSQQIYLGLRDPVQIVSSELNGDSFRGCIKSVKVRATEMQLFKSTSRQNTEEGCPAPAGQDQVSNLL